ncbi:MAG: hypothetical protein ABR575_06335, partial [Actinomycetota bacterium]
VYVLDASAAFAGRSVRPKELGFFVAHSAGRPVPEATVGPQSPFFSTFLNAQPMLWDLFFYKGHILTADMLGGLYSLRYDGDR